MFLWQTGGTEGGGVLNFLKAHGNRDNVVFVTIGQEEVRIEQLNCYFCRFSIWIACFWDTQYMTIGRWIYSFFSRTENGIVYDRYSVSRYVSKWVHELVPHKFMTAIIEQ